MSTIDLGPFAGLVVGCAFYVLTRYVLRRPLKAWRQAVALNRLAAAGLKGCRVEARGHVVTFTTDGRCQCDCGEWAAMSTTQPPDGRWLLNDALEHVTNPGTEATHAP